RTSSLVRTRTWGETTLDNAPAFAKIVASEPLGGWHFPSGSRAFVNNIVPRGRKNACHFAEPVSPHRPAASPAGIHIKRGTQAARDLPFDAAFARDIRCVLVASSAKSTRLKGRCVGPEQVAHIDLRSAGDTTEARRHCLVYPFLPATCWTVIL